MARAELTPLILSRNAGAALTTGNLVLIDSSTGFYVDFSDSSQNNQQGRLILICSGDTAQTTVGTSLGWKIKMKTSTLKAFTGSGQDDVDISIVRSSASPFATTANATNVVCGPLETARFLSSAGYILGDFSTAAGQATLAAGKYIRVSAIVIP